MGHYATGIAVVSTRDGDLKPYGMTISSFASLSLDPPLVQWSVKSSSYGYPIFRVAEMFAINILAADQEKVSRDFSAPVDRFATVNCATGLDDLPLIDGCLGWIECARERIVTIGDHHLIVGQVLRARTFDRPPLVHWRGGYWLLDRLGDSAEPCSMRTTVNKFQAGV